MKALRIYLTSIGLILLWWGLAFSPSTNYPSTSVTAPLSTPIAEVSLLPLDRTAIHQALNGDVHQMVTLIADWDAEARFLKSKGIKGITRLPKQSFLHVQSLRHTLPHSPIKPIRVLPQTYVSAAILLALANPSDIVALPRGMRSQDNLYPSAVMQQILLDTDRYNSEELFTTRPEIAFVAHYSLPATIDVLKNQGIQICELNEIETPQQILETIIRVGEMIGKPERGRLLALFVEAALIAIDNRRQVAWNGHSEPLTLYLNYYTHFSTPTPKSLTGQMLRRIGLNISLPAKDNDTTSPLWSIPMDRETIVQTNPDMIIIASADSNSLRQEISKMPAFRNLRAVLDNRLLFIDETTQESPSQYLALAYFDLNDALTQALCDRPL